MTPLSLGDFVLAIEVPALHQIAQGRIDHGVAIEDCLPDVS
jgi:hypothetical protein